MARSRYICVLSQCCGVVNMLLVISLLYAVPQTCVCLALGRYRACERTRLYWLIIDITARLYCRTFWWASYHIWRVACACQWPCTPSWNHSFWDTVRNYNSALFSHLKYVVPLKYKAQGNRLQLLMSKKCLNNITKCELYNYQTTEYRENTSICPVYFTQMWMSAQRGHISPRTSCRWSHSARGWSSSANPLYDLSSCMD